MPFVIAGASLLALVITVASRQGSTSVTPTAAPPALGPSSAGRAPDISAMTPRERADRLFDRVMTLSAQGKADSASFFASMAVGAYQALAPLDADLRYDYGRMAEMAGDAPLAQAQADSILRENPDHLLGLILAARVAQAGNKPNRAAELFAHVKRSASTELAKNLDEYTRHRNDIDTALQLAKP